MNHFPDAQDAGGFLEPHLSADEYRLLADALLDHIGTDPLHKDQLNSLVQRLFVLAVQAESQTSRAS